MADIGFYHLTRTSALEALPKLLGRVMLLGARAQVLAHDPASIPLISKALWASTEPDWLPHNTSDDPAATARKQPIWLTADPNAPPPNGARFLLTIGGVRSAQAFERIFDLFDGMNEADLQAARLRWSAGKAKGERLSYFQQLERGWTAKT